eukprot:gnl/Spiro4/21759_TR10663_c0_g1_i1.p3 gnl/Spiro4/21759_TR10663_c0_g1~~gnl/Spiro4/21759_TR10663_c0_g1_i1.p3  ORF type:complete len:108 (-),score=18.78 gnl/Spiro4/21759_TR10663_c0_g1_i1:125-448(-)
MQMQRVRGATRPVGRQGRDELSESGLEVAVAAVPPSPRISSSELSKIVRSNCISFGIPTRRQAQNDCASTATTTNYSQLQLRAGGVPPPVPQPAGLLPARSAANQLR